jgi:hypothetical protein
LVCCSPDEARQIRNPGDLDKRMWLHSPITLGALLAECAGFPSSSARRPRPTGLPDSVPSCISQNPSCAHLALSKCAMMSARPAMAASGKPPPMILPSVQMSGVTP